MYLGVQGKYMQFFSKKLVNTFVRFFKFVYVFNQFFYSLKIVEKTTLKRLWTIFKVIYYKV